MTNSLAFYRQSNFTKLWIAAIDYITKNFQKISKKRIETYAVIRCGSY